MQWEIDKPLYKHINGAYSFEALCGNGSLWIHFIKVTNILNKMKLEGPTDRKCYSFNHKMFVSVDSNFTCITEINKNVCIW